MIKNIINTIATITTTKLIIAFLSKVNMNSGYVAEHSDVSISSVINFE